MLGSASAYNTAEGYSCLLQVQKIKSRRGWVNVMWDSAASLCFITNNKAKSEKFKGEKVELSIVKVGGRTERLQSHKYRIPLIDLDGNEVHFDVYGIEKITNNVQNVDVSYIAKLFTDVSTKDIDRPTGEIEVLIGYQYAAYHPQRQQNIGHLLLLKNQFGKCIGGSHNLIRDETQLRTKFEDARVHHVNTVSITNITSMKSKILA